MAKLKGWYRDFPYTPSPNINASHPSLSTSFTRSVNLVTLVKLHWHISQFSSVAQLCLILCHPMDCSTPSLPVHHQLLECAQTHGHLVGDAIQASHSVSSPSPLVFNFSQDQGFSNESVAPIMWQEYWRLSFSMNPSNECSGLISFRIDWLDFLAIQGTLKSLLQHCS